MTPTKITRETLLPVGLVAAIVCLGYAVGYAHSRLNSLEIEFQLEKQARIQAEHRNAVQMREIRDRLATIEGYLRAALKDKK